MSAVLIVLLMAAPAGAQSTADESESDPLRLHVALAAMMAAAGADLATTMYSVGSGQATERNPAFHSFTHEPWAAGAIKMGVAAGVGYVLLKNHKRHPKLTFWTSIALTGLYTSLAAYNTSTTR